MRGLPLLLLGLLATPAFADAKAPATPIAPPSAQTPPAKAIDTGPDVWIFSGVLSGNQESYSGTLVSNKADAQFEMKLANGATCDGADLKGEIGLVRLSEIACTDGRSMKALFVPQSGKSLKVYGHVGDERFSSEAHLLGTEPMPEQKQTAQPTVPQVQPPAGGGSTSEPPSALPKAPPGEIPGPN